MPANRPISKDCRLTGVFRAHLCLNAIWQWEPRSTGTDDIPRRGRCLIVKTLLGIIGSPRRLGNSELLIKEIYRQLPEGWNLKLLRISDFALRPCKGCYQCLFGKMTCVQKDGFQTVLEAMVEADAYAVVAPAYMFGANASLKLLLDRGLSFCRHLDNLWGKPAVGAVLAGFPGLEGHSKLVVDGFIKFIMADHRGSEVIYAAMPGEVFLQDGGKEAAKRLAQALIEGKPQTAEDSWTPKCPLCGGDTFRFLDGTRIKCMLCSNEGTYEWEGEQLKVAVPLPDHAIFLTIEDARNHFAFLQGMKEKFLEKRKELKTVIDDYREEGTWIRPQSE